MTRRVANNIKHLLDLVSQFPRVNPSTATESEGAEELDIPRLFRQIRSRYKALCATLGVRPSLRTSGGEEDNGEVEEDSGAVSGGRKGEVWKVEEASTRTTARPGQDLSF